LKTLQDSKLCSRTKYGVKLLGFFFISNEVHIFCVTFLSVGDGALGFVSKIDIEISAASKTAIEAVERNGGFSLFLYNFQIYLIKLLLCRPYRGEVLLALDATGFA
jgi:hypothetical protein